MNAATAAAACMLCAAAGFIAGRFTPRKSPRLEPPAVAIVHKDGSRTLERTQAAPPPPLPTPPGTVARARAAILELEPITTRSQIQIDLVTMQDGTQRITAKGPSLAGGQDFPIIPARTVQKWTAGVIWEGREVSIIGMRNVGPWSFGVVGRKDRAGIIVALRF